MAREYLYEEGRGPMGAPLSRVRWSSVFAGVVIGLVTYVLLSLLGLAIGLSTFEPTRILEREMDTLGLGGSVWMVLSMLISVFIGAWVSSWWGHTVSSTDGVLHGILTWSLMLLFMLMLVGRGFGSLVGGAFSILSASVPAVSEQMVAEPSGDIERRFNELIVRAAPEDSRLKNLNASPGVKRQVAQQIMMGNDTQAARLLSQNTGLSQSESMAIVEDTKVETREVAQNVTESASRVAWWSFFAVVLSLIAAALGGAKGFDKHYGRSADVT